MKIVGAALGDHVDDAAGGAPIFRREAAGHDLVLLYRIERNLLADHCRELIVVGDAIEHHVGAGRTHAVNRETYAASALRIGRYVRNRGHEIVRIAGQGGKFGHLLGADGVAERLRFRVDLHRAGVHFHRGAGLAHFHFGVQRQLSADVDRHAPFLGGEAAGGNGNFPIAGSQVREHVHSRRVRRGRALCARRNILGRNRHVGYNRAAGVLNRSDNLARLCLAPKHQGGQHQAEDDR